MPANTISLETTPGAAFPLDAVAPTLIEDTARQFARSIRAIKSRGASEKRVHKSRVAARRLEAVVELVGECLDAKQADRLLAHCASWRKAFSRKRKMDVALQWLRDGVQDAGDEPTCPALLHAIGVARKSRRKQIEAKISSSAIERLRSDATDAARNATPPMSGPRLYSDAAATRIGAVAEELEQTSKAAPNTVADAHTVRLLVKRLRYLLELSSACVPPELCARAIDRLAVDQESFGLLADLEDVRSVLESIRASDRRVASEREAALALVAETQEERLGAIRSRIDSGGLASLAHELRSWATDATAMVPMGQPLSTSMENAAGRIEPREDRLAVIDVGSNSVRLLVVEVLADGSYRTLDDEKESTRLGQGLVSTGMLGSSPMVRTAQCIARMRGISQGYGVSRLRVIGTSAVRDATNQREFLALVRETAAVTLEVMSEEDEARNAFRSAAAGVDLSDVHAAVVDIGGGSTEIVLATKGVIEMVCSIPIGAVRVSEMFAGSGGEASVKRMRRYVARCLERAMPRLPLVPSLVVGTGGTFTALAALSGAKVSASGKPSERSVGADLRRSEVRHLLDRLGSMTLRERMRLPRMSPERSDIIVGGAAIAEGVLRHLEVNRLRVYDKGVRDGLMLSMIAERRTTSAPTTGGSHASRILVATRRFAESCRYEKSHSEQVARLSLSIFDQLVELSLLGRRSSAPESRLLLEVAAVLHDIGYLVNYAAHHKHSLRLILNSDLTGLSPRQTAIVANIARYHRRAEPSTRHREYAALSKSDRRLVRQLSGILRVADGLDRAHSQLVEAVRLVMPKAGGGIPELVFSVRASERPTTDLWGAERKMALLEKEFGVKGVCQWELPAVHVAPVRQHSGRNGAAAHQAVIGRET